MAGPDLTAAREWLASAPGRVVAENEASHGRAVERARSWALGLLDRKWDDSIHLDRLVALRVTATRSE